MLKDWYPFFPNPVRAEGILDRLVNRAHHVILTGKSYPLLLGPDRGRTSQREKDLKETVDGGETAAT